MLRKNAFIQKQWQWFGAKASLATVELLGVDHFASPLEDFFDVRVSWVLPLDTPVSSLINFNEDCMKMSSVKNSEYQIVQCTWNQLPSPVYLR